MNVPHSDETWQDIRNFIEVLRDFAQHLCTIRVAFMYGNAHRLSHPYEVYTAFTTREFLHPPPSVLADFPLVQRAEGYRISCKGVNEMVIDGVVLRGVNGVIEWVHETDQIDAYVFSVSLAPSFTEYTVNTVLT
jgi:hypothetical protein